MIKLEEQLKSSLRECTITQHDLCIDDIKDCNSNDKETELNNIKNSISKVCTLWNELDKQYLSNNNKSNNKNKKKELIFPALIDTDTLEVNNDSDPNINEEYVTKLNNLMKDVIKIRDNNTLINNNSNSNDNNLFVLDWLKNCSSDFSMIPELHKEYNYNNEINSSNISNIDINTAISVGTTSKDNDYYHNNSNGNNNNGSISSRLDSRNDEVLTFLVYPIHIDYPHEKIEIIANEHTLLDLINNISCVHDDIRSSSSNNSNSSSNNNSSSISSNSSDDTKLLVIDDVFYINNNSNHNSNSVLSECTEAADSYITSINNWIKNQSRLRTLKRKHQNKNNKTTDKLYHQYKENTATSTISTSNSNNNEVTIRSMSDVLCGETQLRCGVPFVYVHCNGCEHAIYLVDRRVPHRYYDGINNSNGGDSRRGSDQLLMRNSYPRKLICRHARIRKCTVCLQNNAKYIVYNNKLCETNPTELCQFCYHMLHYSKDNKLLYSDYKVFPYISDA